VTFNGRAYATANFRDGGQMQFAPIVVNGQPRGRIDVVYTEERAALDEGPFLKEERSLIDANRGNAAPKRSSHKALRFLAALDEPLTGKPEG
jgi:hypothetical protein